MNIAVPDSWLREYLKTKASPRQIAEALSLCSQSVERQEKVKNDVVYHIEVTTNRSDCFCVYGLARELAAILPRFGHQAHLKKTKETKNISTINKKGLSLKIILTKNSFCPRFTAIVLDRIQVKPSPKIIKDRLEKAGIRALNNVVDIANYLMLAFGQPMHTFDYDKIKGAKMILRTSKKGEKIITLDHQVRQLPEGVMVIEDAHGRLVDLCGIMGAANSAVDSQTKRVLLFVQTYDPQKIRSACQKMAFRTEAASRFEKNVTAEGVLPAMEKAVFMLQKHAHAQIASQLFDLYPQPYQAHRVSLDQKKLNQILGIKLPLKIAKTYLTNLGLDVTCQSQKMTVTVPYWRSDDLKLPEDLAEEIARIYGYHNLPSRLFNQAPPLAIIEPIFAWENQIKKALKFWGFTEIASYSMVSQEMLSKLGLNPKEHLKIANPLTKERVFMRQSLLPSLLEVLAQNQAYKKRIRIFEMANVYLPQNQHHLPQETMTLASLSSEDNFYSMKGFLEAILTELGIKTSNFENYNLEKTLYGKIFSPNRSAEVTLKNNSLGIIGQVKPLVLKSFGLKKQTLAFELDFAALAKFAKRDQKFTPLPQYPPVIEDWTLVVPPQTAVGNMLRLIKEASPLVQKIILKDVFKSSRTFRIFFQSAKKTLTTEEVEKAKKKVLAKIEKKFKAKIKTT